MKNNGGFLLFCICLGVVISTALFLLKYDKPVKKETVKNIQCSCTGGIREVRVTGYIPTGNKTALGDNVVVGRTAAISPACLDLLGKTVYIYGHGVRYINDLTNARADEEYDVCTVDLAVPTKKHAFNVGNNTSRLVQIDKR